MIITLFTCLLHHLTTQNLEHQQLEKLWNNKSESSVCLRKLKLEAI